MENYSHKKFDEMMKDAQNLKCFDCGKRPAQWASVNNAIFLCLNCAGIHRGYGTSISFVRSITIDSWNDSQIALISLGGNNKLNELLGLYGIDKNTTNNLYQTKLLDFYRQFLKFEQSGVGTRPAVVSKNDAMRSMVEEKVIDEKKEKKFESINETLNNISYRTTNQSNNNDRFCSVSSSGNINTNESSFNNPYSSTSSPSLSSNWRHSESGFYENMSKFLGKTYEVGSEMAGSFKDTVSEMDISSKLKTVGSVAVSGGIAVANSGVVQSIAEKAKEGSYILWNYMFNSGKRDQNYGNYSSTSSSTNSNQVSSDSYNVGLNDNDNSNSGYSHFYDSSTVKESSGYGNFSPKKEYFSKESTYGGGNSLDSELQGNIKLNDGGSYNSSEIIKGGNKWK